jgi:hypothetical protein
MSETLRGRGTPANSDRANYRVIGAFCQNLRNEDEAPRFSGEQRQEMVHRGREPSRQLALESNRRIKNSQRTSLAVIRYGYGLGIARREAEPCFGGDHGFSCRRA